MRLMVPAVETAASQDGVDDPQAVRRRLGHSTRRAAVATSHAGCRIVVSVNADR
jgi:hypothetical protein